MVRKQINKKKTVTLVLSYDLNEQIKVRKKNEIENKRVTSYGNHRNKKILKNKFGK